jgi:very-short-patch-repair endonuclease
MSQNLERLKRLLVELCQLDQAELDFGLYRIMNTKREEIVRFLENHLLPQVREVLNALEGERRSVLEAELEKAKEQAKSLGFEDPAQAPKVKELEARWNAAFDVEAAESEVFSHLYSFFRRYYQEGDFISLRRYKEGVYAIPYEGEEVKLYWANHDQYYIKTSEYLRNYTFKLPSGKRVHFKLVEADTEKDNNRPPNGKERRFILSEKQPLAEENGELVIRFEYRPHPDKAKQADLNAAAAERILNQTEGFNDWRYELASLRPTEKKPNRTLLEKHLTDYTARNTFDYFIHKDLGGFLRRELDFYIKNEVMHLDDIESETAPRVEQYLAKIRAIRRIAHKLIDFLAQIENFQKKLWLKKKFVVETQYGVTLDRVPEELYPEIAANDAQWEEWVRLFAINELPDYPWRGEVPSPLVREPAEVPSPLVGEPAEVPSPLWGEGQGEGRKQTKSRTKEEHNALLQEFARLMRHAPTDAEQRLWYFLRDRRLGGYKFRRQHPVGNYIADFACIEGQLIVELDGGQHAELFQKERDLSKTRFFEARGFRVLRFWNNEVLKDTQAVLEEILRTLEEAPHPNPLPIGERETIGERQQGKPLSAGGREIAFLKANPYLVLDTRHFSEDFKRRLLASFDDLDEQCDGLLIHSENFQALNLLLERYRGQVKCVYIDPPYNTDQDRHTGKFLYKNAYEHSTWLTMMTNRLSLDAQLLDPEGAHFVSTDENELHRLVSIIMGYARKYHGLFTWRRTRTGGHLSSAFNQLSDYVVVSTNPSGNQLFGGQADPDESQPLVKASNLRKELRFPAGSIEFLDKQSGIIPAGTKGTGANPVSCLTHIEIVNGKNVSEVVLSGPFVWTQQRLESELAAGARIVIKRAVSLNPRFFRIPRGHKPFPSLADDYFPVGTNEDGSEELESILGPGPGFTYPKPVLLIQRIVQSKSFFNKNLTVLDFFAGSGTTAHAVINLNREDGGRRKYILVEMGEYFDTVLVPRIKKVVYSRDWKDGKPLTPTLSPKGRGQGEGTGISHMFKYIRLESYEDTLNNLELRRTEAQLRLLEEHPGFREDYMLRYMLDVESRGSASLLNLDRFEDPFSYQLDIATGTAGETKPTVVGLVETFNYLIGLRVKTIDHIGGVRVVTGTNPQGERLLILWRKTKELNNDALDAWFCKQGYNTKEQEYDVIYVNGDNNLENLKRPDQTWKVRLIEEEFLQRMFDVQDV